MKRVIVFMLTFSLLFVLSGCVVTPPIAVVPKPPPEIEEKVKHYLEKAKKFKKAKKYGFDYIAVSRALEIWPTYPDTDKMIEKLNDRVVHIVKSSDIFSKLISHYYGKTEGYKLVDIVGSYNGIDNYRIIPGDILYFPQIPIENEIYSPKRETKGHQRFIKKLMKKAERDIKKKKYNDAIEKLEKVVSIQPENDDALKLLNMLYPNRGQSLFEQRKYKDAQNIYEALFIIDHNCIKSDCNEYEAKIKKCKSLYLEYHYTKAIEFMKKEQWESAIEEFDFVIANDRNYKDIAQKKQKSIRRLKNIEFKRRHYDTHFKNGNKLLHQNNYLAAKKQFEESSDIV